MAKKKKPGKYERREFLKQIGRVGLGTAVYGGVGYLAGRGYKEGKELYTEYVKPGVDKTKEVYDKTGEAVKNVADGTKKVGQDIGDLWTKNFNKSKYEERIKTREEKERIKREEELEKIRQSEEAEKMSRRGFFKKYFHLFNEHPVGTGTLTGASLGTLVKTLSLYPRYLDKKKVAILKDEHAEYGEKIKILEEYKERLERREDEKENKIKGLENEIKKLKTIYKKLNLPEEDSSGLEDRLKKGDENKSLLMVISGVVLAIGFLVIKGFEYTGFSVSSGDFMIFSDFLGLIIIFTSLTLMVLGVLGLRNQKKTN